ncbi:MAG TPA: tRNA (adenosine(37)-N6)-threonylcarbamoyltransferase complex dimerization subunit type 1 TsaB [Acidobacteriaceae bacterium]|nr:tRNA (adenosine(37)-N6)-threonylcarbamoyltransferase complex dimerization subunit type 1 TsaB [Acidobacteriaceae bacterium]
MLLLVVDTAGHTGGVLLARLTENNRHESPWVEIYGEIGLHPRQFSAELIPAIAELLRANERRLADVDAFAVVSGPGSFTGLRVGLSAVKAMAEATGKPILTLSRLAILASVAAKPSSGELADAAAHVVLDAGRGEFYHGVYRDAGKTRVAESFETLESLTEKIGQQPGWVIVSEAPVKAAIESVAGSRSCEVPLPSVRDALPLAVVEWRGRRFHDPGSVDANYLRRSDTVVVVRTKADPMAARATRAEDLP